jgi:hypothetical protein
MVRPSVRVCASLLFICSYFPLFAQQAGSNQKPPTPSPAPGTLNFIARWTGTSTLGNANIFQSTTNKIGINNSTPAAELDVNGTEAVRDTLTLIPNSTHPVLSLNGATFKISSTGVVTFVSGQTFPGAGTVTSVATGAGLTGGPITKTGTVSIATGGVTNAMLLHPSLTMTAGSGLSGGGSIALGGSGTLSVASGGVTNAMLQHSSVTVTAGSGLSGGGSVALGNNVTLNNTGVLSVGNGSGLTNTGGQNPTLDINTSVVPTLAGSNFFSGFSDFDGNEPVWEVEVSNSGQGDAIIASNNSVDSTHPTLSLTNGDTTSAGDLVLDVVGSGFGGECTMDVTGNLFCTGTLGGTARLNSKRQVGIYSVQSPENWIEDFGTGSLFGGVTTINLDPTFARTISGKADYHVFLTPAGECEGLYVASRSPTSFEVRELKRGTSNAQFDYRIVGHRKGLETVRLPELKLGNPKPVMQQDGHVAGSR